MTVRTEVPGVLYRMEPAAEAAIPLVFDSPHSGRVVPEDFLSVASLAALRSSEDAFVDELFHAAPGHGAGLLAALFPRSYVDTNRAVDDIDAALLDAPWPEPTAPSEKARAGMGVIRRFALPGQPMYERRLTVTEVRRRLDGFYVPYHAALQEMLDAAHARFGVVYHLNCHSMKAVGNAMNTDAGKPRPDFVVSDRDGTTTEPGFLDCLVGSLRGRGHSVAANDPYKGMELIRRHGRPAEGRHSVQIEINRGLYMDEATFDRGGRFAPVRALMDAVVGELAGYVRDKR